MGGWGLVKIRKGGGGRGPTKNPKLNKREGLFFGTEEYWYLGNNKNKELFRKELNKLEIKFTEGQKKLNSLENKLQSNVRNQSR